MGHHPVTLHRPPAKTRPSDAIGELLDRAVHAVNAGDIEAAHDLAGRVLAQDAENREAVDLLATDAAPSGEVRRLTILSCDLVGSTALSEQLDVEQYRWVMRAFTRSAREIIEDRYDGYINNIKGDGIFALFGYPTAHEEDAARGVKAALDLCRTVAELSTRTEASVAAALSVRVAVHRGLVFLDADTAEVYGLAANLTSRLEGLAEPGQVVISEEVRTVVSDYFAIEPGGLHLVKGVTEPLQIFTVQGELPESAKLRVRASLVGRRSELEALRSAWRTARDCDAPGVQSVLIRGESGLGKSRLAATLAAEVRADGAPVIELAGSSFHTDAGFHPVRRLLELRCGIGPGSSAGERLALLRDELKIQGFDEIAVALIAPVLGLAPQSGYSPASAEGRKLSEEISDAIEQYLLACFHGRPGMLLVEDVHWFDGSTLNQLTKVIGASHPELLVVLTSRLDVSLNVGTAIDLTALDTTECNDLVDALTGGALDASARQAIVERSDGIPLYVEELLRGGVGPIEGLPGAVPDVLYEPLISRLYTTAHGVPVAAAAATIGRVVDRSLLAGVVDVSDAELDAELDALVNGQVLVGLEGDDQYRFRHELLREVAYELLPASQRQRVHGRVADLLIENDPHTAVVDWSVVATHYHHAHRHREAADAYAHAAELARSRGAIPEARAHLGRAIEHVGRLPANRARMNREVGLRLRRGFLAMSAEAVGSIDAAADFARCLELAIVDARGDEMFSTLISLWAYHVSRAELGRAEQVLDTLRPTLTGSREHLWATNRAGYGMLQWFRGDFAGARGVLEEAVAGLVADAPDDVDTFWFVPNDPATSMHTHLALARFMTGDTAGADSELALVDERVARLAFPQGPWSLAYSSWMEAWIRAEQGSFARAASSAESVVEIAGRHGFDGWTMIGMTHQAAIAAASETASGAVSPDVAKMHADSVDAFVALWKLSELLVLLPYYLTTIASAAAAAGDSLQALARCEEALELGESTGMHFYDAETRRQMALLRGDGPTTITELQSAFALAHEQGAKPFELRIALDLHEHNASESREALAAVVASFPDDAELADLTRARALLDTNA